MKNNLFPSLPRQILFVSLIFALLSNVGCQSSNNASSGENAKPETSTTQENSEIKPKPEDKITLPANPTDSKSVIEVLFHEIFRLSNLQTEQIEDFLEQSYSKNTTLRLQWVHSNKELHLEDIYPDHIIQNFGWCDLNSRTTLVPCAVIFDISKFSRKGLPDRFLFRVLDRRSDNGPSVLYSSGQVEGQQLIPHGKYFTNLDTKNKSISYSDLWQKIESFKQLRDLKKLPHPMGKIEINPILFRESEINSYLIVKNLCPSSKMNELLPNFETAVQGNYGIDVNYHSAISDLGSHPDFLEVDIRYGNYVNLIAVKFPDNYVMSIKSKYYVNNWFVGYGDQSEKSIIFKISGLSKESFFHTKTYKTLTEQNSLANLCFRAILRTASKKTPDQLSFSYEDALNYRDDVGYDAIEFYLSGNLNTKLSLDHIDYLILEMLKKKIIYDPNNLYQTNNYFIQIGSSSLLESYFKKFNYLSSMDRNTFQKVWNPSLLRFDQLKDNSNE